MITDEIDRLHGETLEPARLGTSCGSINHRVDYNSTYKSSNCSSVYHSTPPISIDAASASEISRRYNLIVYSLYAAGAGRTGRSGFQISTTFFPSIASSKGRFSTCQGPD